jgi:dephospho-CoA kinase
MRIGVTGIYASGKSTVCGMFERLGGVIIDTDIIAREIVTPGSPGLQAVITQFGNEFLDEQGNPKRRELANFVFADAQRTQKLNSITHPLILEKTLHSSSDSENRLYFINAPLLFEAGFNAYMEKTILVTSTTDLSVKRGKNRDNLTENEILSRINSQLSLNERIKRADYIIDNSKTVDYTQEQVEKLWKILTRILTQTRNR